MADKRVRQSDSAAVDPDFKAGFYGGPRMTPTLDPKELFGQPKNTTRRDRPVRLRPSAKRVDGPEPDVVSERR